MESCVGNFSGIVVEPPRLQPYFPDSTDQEIRISEVSLSLQPRGTQRLVGEQIAAPGVRHNSGDCPKATQKAGAMFTVSGPSQSTGWPSIRAVSSFPRVSVSVLQPLGCRLVVVRLQYVSYIRLMNFGIAPTTCSVTNEDR